MTRIIVEKLHRTRNMYYAKLIIAMEQIDFPSKNIVQNGRNLLVFLPEKKQSNVCLYYTIYFDCHVMDMNFLGCSYHTMKNETKLSCDLSKCFESEMTRKKKSKKTSQPQITWLLVLVPPVLALLQPQVHLHQLSFPTVPSFSAFQ